MYYPRKIPSSFQKQDDCTTSAPVVLESKEKHTTVSVRKTSLSPFAAFLFLELLKKGRNEKPPPAIFAEARMLFANQDSSFSSVIPPIGLIFFV